MDSGSVSYHSFGEHVALTKIEKRRSQCQHRPGANCKERQQVPSWHSARSSVSTNYRIESYSVETLLRTRVGKSDRKRAAVLERDVGVRASSQPQNPFAGFQILKADRIPELNNLPANQTHPKRPRTSCRVYSPRFAPDRGVSGPEAAIESPAPCLV